MRRSLAITLGLFMSSLATASVNDGVIAYNAGNFAEAVKQFLSAAESGDPSGKHMLASLYYQGHGVDRDLKKAVALFKAHILRMLQRNSSQLPRRRGAVG